MRLPLIAGILGSLLIAASPGTAHAHADSVGSAPRQGAVLNQSPSSITIRFSENVTFDSIPPLTSTDGKPIETTASLQGSTMTLRPIQPLPRGTTIVTWRVISDDGHPVSGVLSFLVGKPGPRGPKLSVTTTPSVPAVLSGNRPGPLTLTFGKAGSSGEVEWTNPQLGGAITWQIAPGSRSATGILPLPGAWHMKAILQSPQFAVVIVNGEVTLRG